MKTDDDNVPMYLSHITYTRFSFRLIYFSVNPSPCGLNFCFMTVQENYTFQTHFNLIWLKKKTWKMCWQFEKTQSIIVELLDFINLAQNDDITSFRKDTKQNHLDRFLSKSRT